jgi:phosphoribosylaminoimidazole carboxylase PurE protein
MLSVVILMGSKSDLPFVAKITSALDALGIAHDQRIASAHKCVRYLLKLLDKYEGSEQVGAYITVAGRSNALSGVVDANVTVPVIACPPYSDKFAGSDLYSSLRMPSGVAPAVVLEPAGAALLAAKILAATDPDLRARIAQMQQAQTASVIAADAELQKPNHRS